jgi:charged multivesicular body protein 5
MKKEYKKLDINKIDNMQDEMEDMLDMNNEIQEAMSRQYDTPDVSPALRNRGNIGIRLTRRISRRSWTRSAMNWS